MRRLDRRAGLEIVGVLHVAPALFGWADKHQRRRRISGSCSHDATAIVGWVTNLPGALLGTIPSQKGKTIFLEDATPK